MDSSTKRQLVGAAVIVALAVIFLPMFFSSPKEREQVDVPLEVPPRPEEGAAQSGQAGQTEQQQQQQQQRRVAEPHRDMDERQQPGVADAGGSDANGRSGERALEQQSDSSSTAAVQGVPLEQGAYAVQVGSFRNQDNAYGFRDKVRNMGMPAYVDRTELGGSPVYRVRLGPVMDRDRAEKMLERASGELEVQGWVVSL